VRIGSIVVQRNPEDPDTWDLVVDGRIQIRGESFTVCDRVRYALLGDDSVTGEPRELALGILQGVRP